MDRDQVLKILKQHQAELDGFGISRLLLFGSVARGEARPDSDVDLLVDFNRLMGLFGLAAVQLRLEELLGCPVDVGTLDSLKPRLHDTILAECVHVAWKME